MMRLAYLILAHGNKPQLERLAKSLVYPNTDIYIHLDTKIGISEFADLAQLDGVSFIKKRTNVKWGDYSMVAATLISFEEILNTGNNYSHINLLSGQDYPLKSAATIQKFLFENPDKSFIRYRSILDDWQQSISRITMYSLGDYNIPFRFKIQDLLNKFLPDKKMPLGLKPYGFSQWITITPACAAYSLNYLKSHRSARRFFRLTWAVDEIVFQTILMNSPLKDSIVNDHLRYIKFKNAASRPNTLTIADAKLLTDSNKFFARKFDPQIDSKILDYLDAVAEKEK
ncbi:beta-1,6-N-acetylglucosaminyltransferase [Mucilaginibacter corticis]|uniref:Peptide O-xylosyltransferase n=1 Tax=Mucilaginibacter corticis TaxID=2597670 RepID=A0A556MLN6_9SPHI|nr:beta-1,6-N-acetylglucosaminyltransferase [Mucilaginibacter corticis]TSJ40758.1 beta-1,6-N-acetylglucosaminyltransferase [Mucilaginibacter corticis]